MKHLKPIFLLIVLVFLWGSAPACSTNEGERPAPAAIRYAHDPSLVSGEPRLDVLSTIDYDIFDRGIAPILDEDFSSLESWKMLGNKKNSAGIMDHADSPEYAGGKALRIQPGKGRAGRLADVSDRIPLTVCLRMKLPPSADLEEFRAFLEVIQCKRSEEEGLDRIGSSAFVGIHTAWIPIATQGEWLDLFQVIEPAKKAQSFLFRLSPANAALEAGNEILVDRILIRPSTVAEVARALLRDLSPGSNSKTNPMVPYVAGKEIRPSILLADGGFLFLPYPAGGERRLRFGLAFPATRCPGHSRGCTLTLELATKKKGEGLLHREVISVPDTGGRSSRWLEKTAALPASPDPGAIILRLEGEGAGKVLAVCGAPVLLQPAETKPVPRVVLISIDTLRADRLGVYGGSHPQGVSPFIDAIAQESAVFENAMAQAPYTLPSHVSMLSGQYPSVHKVVKMTHRINPERTPLLAAQLSRAGYTTGAFTGGGLVHYDIGFNVGFDTYGTDDPVRRGLIERTLEWVKANRSVPFFLFFHTYAVHEFAFGNYYSDYLERFDPGCTSKLHGLNSSGEQLGWVMHPESYDEADRQCLDNRYAAGIRLTDDTLRILLNCLESEGMMDNTLLIITSDHGQELLDRGKIQHGLSLYEELVHVPLIIRPPGGMASQRRIPDLVEVIDVYPTILDFLNLPIPEGIQGQPLGSLLEGVGASSVGAVSFSEVDYEVGHIHPRICSLRTRHYKLIHNIEPMGIPEENYKDYEFYHLDGDPGERTDVAAGSDQFEILRSQMSRLLKTLEIASKQAKGHEVQEGTIDPELMEELRALGYMK